LNGRAHRAKLSAMQDTDLLTAMAQLAVGLAGFTGVASVFDRRGDHMHARAQAERLRGMLEMALIVAGAALLPIVLERTGVDAPLAWRIAAACLLTITVPGSILGIRRATAVNRAAGTSNSLWRIYVNATALFVVAALIAGLAEWVPVAPAYVAALYALLVWSGVLFLRFFLAGS
jgi:hypothetical protein